MDETNMRNDQDAPVERPSTPENTETYSATTPPPGPRRARPGVRDLNSLPPRETSPSETAFGRWNERRAQTDRVPIPEPPPNTYWTTMDAEITEAQRAATSPELDERGDPQSKEKNEILDTSLPDSAMPDYEPDPAVGNSGPSPDPDTAMADYLADLAPYSNVAGPVLRVVGYPSSATERTGRQFNQLERGGVQLDRRAPSKRGKNSKPGNNSKSSKKSNRERIDSMNDGNPEENESMDDGDPEVYDEEPFPPPKD